MRNGIGFTLIGLGILGILIFFLDLEPIEGEIFLIGVGVSAFLLGLGYIWWRGEEILEWMDGEE